MNKCLFEPVACLFLSVCYVKLTLSFRVWMYSCSNGMDVNYCISTPNVNIQYELIQFAQKPVKSVGKINPCMKYM